MEFELTIAKDSPHFKFTSRSKSLWKNRIVHKNNSKEESSSCRCTTTSYGEIHTTKKYVLLIPFLCPQMQMRFSLGHWSFLGPGSESKWNATGSCKLGGEWDRVAEIMMLNFGESSHPVFRATSPLTRGALKK